MDRSKRRVVCACIRAADGELLLGIRHYSRDMRRQIDSRPDGNKFKLRFGEDQGFVDQHGKFLSRTEAYQIAVDTERLTFPEACEDGPDGPKLYSEGLY